MCGARVYVVCGDRSEGVEVVGGGGGVGMVLGWERCYCNGCGGGGSWRCDMVAR